MLAISFCKCDCGVEIELLQELDENNTSVYLSMRSEI
jgi:hypothetical protein